MSVMVLLVVAHEHPQIGFPRAKRGRNVQTGTVRGTWRILFLLGSTGTFKLAVPDMKHSFSNSSSGEFLPEDFFGIYIFLFANMPYSNLANNVVTSE